MAMIMSLLIIWWPEAETGEEGIVWFANLSTMGSSATRLHYTHWSVTSQWLIEGLSHKFPQGLIFRPLTFYTYFLRFINTWWYNNFERPLLLCHNSAAIWIFFFLIIIFTKNIEIKLRWNKLRSLLVFPVRRRRGNQF